MLFSVCILTHVNFSRCTGIEDPGRAVSISVVIWQHYKSLYIDMIYIAMFNICNMAAFFLTHLLGIFHPKNCVCSKSCHACSPWPHIITSLVLPLAVCLQHWEVCANREGMGLVLVRPIAVPGGYVHIASWATTTSNPVGCSDASIDSWLLQDPLPTLCVHTRKNPFHALNH